MNKRNKISYLALDQSFDYSSHVVVTYYMESFDVNINQLAESLAAESSIGTWTDIGKIDEKLFSKYAAKVFEINEVGDMRASIRVAYPIGLFEPDNIPQILSNISGNVFSISGIKNLRVKDIELPEHLLESHKGPAFGVQGIREVLKVHDRPLLSTVIKPKTGLPTREFVQIAYESWVGGVDIVKDDEMLTDQDFNPFYDRVTQMITARRKAEAATGEQKVYCPNISARLSEMYARGKFIREMGGRALMIDVLTVGFSGVQFIREQELGLIMHGHRAMHAAFSHLKSHGISMLVIAKLARIAGIDQLHSGTIIGASESRDEDVKTVDEALLRNWYGIKPTMPVASGGLHPGLIPDLISVLGKDIIINVGGGIHGHPNGTTSGAKAARQAIDAAMAGEEIKSYTQSHGELKQALDFWGSTTEHKTKSYVHALAVSQNVSLTKFED